MDVPFKIKPRAPLRFPIQAGSFFVELRQDSMPCYKIPKRTQCWLSWQSLTDLSVCLRARKRGSCKANSREQELQLPVSSSSLEAQGFSKEFVAFLYGLYQRGMIHLSPELVWVCYADWKAGGRIERLEEEGITAIAPQGVEIALEILQSCELYDEEDGDVTKKGRTVALGVVLQGLLEHGKGLAYGPDSDHLLNWLNYEQEGSDQVLSMSDCGVREAVQVGTSQEQEAPGMQEGKGKRTKCWLEMYRENGECFNGDGSGCSLRSTSISQMNASSHWNEITDSRDFDVFRLFEEVSDLDLPLAVKPEGVSSHAKRYQLQALTWMKRREDDALECTSLSKQKPLLLHPCWMQVVTQDGQVMYLNRMNGAISVNFYRAPTSSTCGGLLCDEMGLGKTLEILMLILAHPPPRGWAETSKSSTGLRKGELSSTLVIGAKLRRENLSEKTGADMEMPEPSDEDPDADVVAIKATLIVVPSSLIYQWQHEIEIHIEPGRLSWAIYNGYEFIPWDQLDIVLTSYEVLRKVVASGESPLLQYGFWRMVLDEGQLAAKSNSVAASTAASIYRRHAWVVTGTPVTSRLEELQGLLDFLAVRPFGEPFIWKTMFQGPVLRHETIGLLRLRLLLKKILLRRTKQQVKSEVNLSDCTWVDIYVTLSETEGSTYDHCYREFVQIVELLKRKRMRRGLTDGHDLNNFSSRVTGRMLSALTRLRQSCCHPQIIKQETRFLGSVRLTMEDIMNKLVVKAKMEFDGAVREWMNSRIALAEVRGVTALEEFRILLKEIKDRKSAIPQRYCADSLTKSRTILADKKSIVARRQYLENSVNVHKDLSAPEKSELVEDIDEIQNLGISTVSGEVITNGIYQKQLRLWSRLELSALTAYSKVLDENRLESEDLNLEALSTLSIIQALRKDLGLSNVKPCPMVEAKTRAAKRQNAALLKIENIAGLHRSHAKKARTEDKILRDLEKTRQCMEKLSHNEKHLKEKLIQMLKGKNAEAQQPVFANTESSDSKIGLSTEFREFSQSEEHIQENATTCPVCFESYVDDCSVTICGHYFCTSCIQEVVNMRDKSSKCPICRTPLQPPDIFHVCLQSEKFLPDLNGEYGAKISALLSELILLGERDPTAKSVIFSSWSRLLNIVSSALSDNSLPHTYLIGTDNNRQEAIHRFNTDPSIRCILVIMSNSGGASGLNLTAASTVFILEPSLNPGLEAQAAGRVHRLTQAKPTKVVRFIAEHTVEERILRLQQQKMTSGTQGLVVEDLCGDDLLELVAS